MKEDLANRKLKKCVRMKYWNILNTAAQQRWFCLFPKLWKKLRHWFSKTIIGKFWSCLRRSWQSVKFIDQVLCRTWLPQFSKISKKLIAYAISYAEALSYIHCCWREVGDSSQSLTWFTMQVNKQIIISHISLAQKHNKENFEKVQYSSIPKLFNFS